MKLNALLLLVLSVLIAHSALAATTCINRASSPISDGSGGFFTQFDCTFFRETVYPFDLAPFITAGIAPAFYAENYQGAGYLVISADANDANNGTLTNPAAFRDILYFQPNQLAGAASSLVSLFWPVGSGGPGFPSVSAITAGGYLVLPWVPGGIEVFVGDANHTYTINENPVGTVVPEPSTLLMGLAGGLCVLIARRRRS